MKKYEVKITNLPVDWKKIKKAKIDEYVWGGEYTPESYAQLAYVPGKGFYVKLSSKESDPRAVYTEPMDPVFKDSCLEFFACFKKGMGYINCELNSNGAVLSAYGRERADRVRLDNIAGKFPEVVKVTKRRNSWSVVAFIGLDIIKSVYGDVRFREGSVIYGNFYKCGDECAVAHYGSFSPVCSEKPDFHRPEYFAEFKLVK